MYQQRLARWSIVVHALATLGVLMLASTFAIAAERTAADLDAIIKRGEVEGVIRQPVGVTRKGTPIVALITRDDLDLHTKKRRVLIIGGLDGFIDAPRLVADGMAWFYTSPQAAKSRETNAVSVIPCANPDGWMSGESGKHNNGAGGDPTVGYPPAGDAYSSKTDPEAAYLWRWIGMHAPDIVVDLRRGDRVMWVVPKRGVPDALFVAMSQAEPEFVSHALDGKSFTSVLSQGAPCDVAAVPAIELRVGLGKTGPDEFLSALIRSVNDAKLGASPARLRLQERDKRSALEIATLLSKHYGHDLKDVSYIPSLALIGRVRLGELTDDKSQLADVERIVAPYVNGDKKALTSSTNGGQFAGHLVFGELALRQAPGLGQEYTSLSRAAADVAFDGKGDMLPAMPGHSEMSDSVFMCCPLLARVGRLTGDRKYDNMCVRHLRFMRKLCVREDGLYRHSPLDEAAWGRGNGFPALGLALVLTDLPADHADRAEVLDNFRGHIEALVKHQDATGMWHQVIDCPESYREFTATCMITFAITRGIRMGWLDGAKYEPVVNRAWGAIRLRIADDGGLVDVCTGTGKQKSLRDYLDRTAILGRDARGGAMAIMLATEIETWKRAR